MARFDTVTVGGSEMRICLAAPAGAGPHPGVLVMSHIGGLDAFTQDRVDKLAAAGFAAAAPDVFHYHPWVEEREARRATLEDGRILDDARATVAHMQKALGADGGRLGVIGHCMGGRLALLAAGTLPDLRALGIFYGGRTMANWRSAGPTPFERIAKVRGRVIGFFGLEDTEPAPADVDKIEAEFGRHGIPCEFHRYPDTGHAFQNFLMPDRYREGPDKDAWARLIAFLRATLAA